MSIKPLDPSISIIRVFSMLLIITTHFMSWKKINDFQISTIGVACFLFISGYLYGTKNIDKKSEWLKKRVQRILVPFWILALSLSIYLVVKGEYLFAFRQIIESLLNLQGLHSVIHIPFSLGTSHLPGLAHCWFLTVIMLCYLGVVFIKKTKLEHFCDLHPKSALFVIVWIHALLSFINVSFGYFIIFYVGYFFNRRTSLKNVSLKLLFGSIILMLFVVAVRISLRKFIDGDVFYDFFVAPFSVNLCAVSFFIFIKWICEKARFVNNFVGSMLWKRVDLFSYPLYLTHYMFLNDPFNINKSFPPQIGLEIIVFATLSVITAVVLDSISKKITRQ